MIRAACNGSGRAAQRRVWRLRCPVCRLIDAAIAIADPVDTPGRLIVRPLPIGHGEDDHIVFHDQPTLGGGHGAR